MNWNEDTYNKFDLSDISNLEAKEKVAEKIVDKVKDGDVIGFGSAQHLIWQQLLLQIL